MPRPRLPALAALAAMVIAVSASAAPADIFRTLTPETRDLSAYRWNARPVVIFALSPEDPDYTQAMAGLQQAEAGLAERDVVVLTDTDPGAKGLYRARIAPEGFTMLLIGKDGRIKLQSRTVLSVDQLFASIDRMPMRLREMAN